MTAPDRHITTTLELPANRPIIGWPIDQVLCPAGFEFHWDDLHQVIGVNFNSIDFDTVYEAELMDMDSFSVFFGEKTSIIAELLQREYPNYTDFLEAGSPLVAGYAEYLSWQFNLLQGHCFSNK